MYSVTNVTITTQQTVQKTEQISIQDSQGNPADLTNGFVYGYLGSLSLSMFDGCLVINEDTGQVIMYLSSNKTSALSVGAHDLSLFFYSNGIVYPIVTGTVTSAAAPSSSPGTILYVGEFDQSGVNAPTVTAERYTSIGTPTPSYSGVGSYILTFGSGSFNILTDTVEFAVLSPIILTLNGLLISDTQMFISVVGTSGAVNGHAWKVRVERW